MAAPHPTDPETPIGIIREAHRHLRHYVEKAKFKGYDPYDTLNSPLPFHWLGKWGPVLAIQFQKRNPVNIRPLIGIKKGVNPKAMGLFLHAYSLLYQFSGAEAFREQADFCFRWLMDNPTEGFKGLCWGYNFDWASPVKTLKAYSPTIVVSGFVAKGIWAYYQATQSDEAAKALESIGEFAWEELPRTEDKNGICISYSTIQPDVCYNASMLGAELYARLWQITKKAEYLERAESVTNHTLAQQHEDGHWGYSVSLKTGEERKQIDFHQGYVLDSIFNVGQFTERPEKYQAALKKGLRFYTQKQFNRHGRAYWRIPRKWPVDIHNQAQGIITHTRLNSFGPDTLDTASRIAVWTIQNMQHPSGGFRYKLYPYYRINTPFMRWGQAWMFLALTEWLTTVENPSR